MPHTKKSDRIRIVVADDHPMMRAGIVRALQGESDLVVVGDGGTANEALRLCLDLSPNVALIDLNMPGCGLAAVARISASCPATAALVLSSRDDFDSVVAAFAGGARGYALKGITARELVRAIRAVHRGESYVTPALSESLPALGTAIGAGHARSPPLMAGARRH